MKIEEIVKILDGKVIVKSHDLEHEVNSACGADLMSDVMAFSKDNVILITGLVNIQVIRTAEMMDIKVIVFVRGKTPNENMKELAEELGISIIVTEELMFASCGKLYKKGLNGGIN